MGGLKTAVVGDKTGRSDGYIERLRQYGHVSMPGVDNSSRSNRVALRTF